MKNINLEPKLAGNIEGEFYIPSYQRGYRWKEEVKRLLDDFEEIDEGKNYCLQPIVVKNICEKRYELIDGQQRLTTIYLIIKYMKQLGLPFQINFSIDYQIRKDSRNFLENITVHDLEDVAKINKCFIDEFFMIEAFKTISTWFKSKKDEALAAFNLYKKLNEKISVIWYEVDSDEDSTSLFTRLNIGRIPLTNAELVKALFLSQNNDIGERKQLEIATQWDFIEKELQDDNFWYFITNEDAQTYPTRIELIFNIMAKKQKDEREKFFTFFYFCDLIKKSKNKSNIWTTIQRCFQKLKEWYENNNLYHKIGYLISSDIGLQIIIDKSTIFDEASNAIVTKTKFQESLDELIAKSIDFKKDYCELNYSNPNDYNDIKKILLLFNVETIRQKNDDSMRFSFSKHKKQNWSLEHIHAQVSEGLSKNEQWIEWLQLHKKSLLSIDANENTNLIQEIELAEKNDKLTGEQFSLLSQKIIKILSEEGSTDYLHTLSNMALLEQSKNSALSNSTFDVKRNKIIEIDKTGEYLPICTRMVFLKYYTPSEFNQLHFWGENDRKAYISEMNKVLKNYLSIINKKITI